MAGYEGPTDRALQWGDIPRSGQKTLNGIMRDWGNFATRSEGVIDQLGRSKAKTAPKRLESIEAIQPHLKDKPVTLRGATDRRVEHFINGTHRSVDEDVTSGAGWYFEHHRDIAGMAAEHDVPTSWAINAGAAMSPNNSPENEKAATHELMKELRGKPVDQTQLGRGGTFRNVDRARRILSGGHETPFNPPPDAPKIRSYRDATLRSVPDSQVHDEYMGRVHHAQDVITGRQIKGQGRLDLWGLQDSTEGVLSPTGNTAEDTWMNAITMGQDIDKSVGPKNVAKAAASDKSLGMDIPTRGVFPNAGSAAILHAYNNEATVRASRRIGEMTGVENFPAIATQEVAWTEARRRAGKDPEYNQQRVTPKIRPSRQGKLF